MGVVEALAEAGAKPAGKRPWFLDADTEMVLAVTMGVAQELAVSRQRLDTLERLLQQKGILSPGEIDAFAPDPQAAVERALWSQEYIARVLRIVQQRNAAAAGDVASEDVSDELGREG
jgi:hypothetical protein